MSLFITHRRSKVKNIGGGGGGRGGANFSLAVD